MTDFLRWTNFASPELVHMAREAVARNHASMEDSSAITGGPEHRKSSIIWHYQWAPLYDAFRARLEEMFPIVRSAFSDIMPERVADVEIQLTLHNDGEFYKKHLDNGDSVSATRRMSFVYYFTPTGTKGFTQGYLTIDGLSGQTHTIDPDENSIVFFPSCCWHEVQPSVVPSKRWQDSRATLNGWVRAVVE